MYTYMYIHNLPKPKPVTVLLARCMNAYFMGQNLNLEQHFLIMPFAIIGTCAQTLVSDLGWRWYRMAITLIPQCNQMLFKSYFYNNIYELAIFIFDFYS